MLVPFLTSNFEFKMSKISKFNICKCFYTENYFINSIRAHLRYESDEPFLRDYSYSLEILKQYGGKCVELLDEVKIEKERRRKVVEGASKRRAIIQEKYTPLHKELFEFKETYLNPRFLKLWNDICNGDRNALKPYRVSGEKFGLYQFPVFTDEFCQHLLDEMDNFRRSDLPRMRPNTMNYNGIILDEIGFASFLDTFREKYLNVISSSVYPEWIGSSSLDSHRTFTVSYAVESAKHSKIDHQSQVDLALHYDNAEVTLNVSLNDRFDGGEIYFGKLRTGHNSSIPFSTRDAVLEHRKGWAILHRGRHLHGALPIESGTRENLIIWMRSSAIRNELCPMCWRRPDLVSVEDSYGDGFTSCDA